MTDLYLTKEGLEKIKKELDELKNVRRPAVVSRIKTAKEFGDLSENAEYDDARNEQSFIEGKIRELENMLKQAKFVTEHAKSGKVFVGSKVTLHCDGEESIYEIVGANESDPSKGKISSGSPIAQALLGKQKGEALKIKTPGGEMECKVISIN